MKEVAVEVVGGILTVGFVWICFWLAALGL